MRIIKEAAELDRIADQLDDEVHRQTNPHHLGVTAQHKVARAGRMLLTRLDAGLIPPFRNAASLLGPFINDKKGEPIPISQLPDKKVLELWAFNLCAWLRCRRPEAFNEADGNYDWPSYRCDAKGRPLTAKGRPISQPSPRRKQTAQGWQPPPQDPPPQMHSPLGPLDGYDQSAAFTHLRNQVSDWAHACRVAADVLRELENRAVQEEAPAEAAPQLFPDLPPLQRKIIDALAGKGKVRYSAVLKTAYKRSKPRQNEEESFHKLISRMNGGLTGREPRVEVKKKGDHMWLADINTGEPWTADGQK